MADDIQNDPQVASFTTTYGNEGISMVAGRWLLAARSISVG